ncbi:hypothetical protein ABEG17_09055 [Pedococcus sp. KACC 23699]|uniref:Lipoprotein n=1 Tax=Pedococcus sp. KACC 23699 TaxID=3149228 RepID=A0AAU7JYD4_9MICO
MRPLRPLLVLTAVAVLGACGTGGSTGGSSTSGTAGDTTPSASTTTTSAAPEDPTLPPPSGGKVRLLTVTGSVSAGVESGCLLLTPTPADSNGPWQLMGKVAGIKPGQQVTVRGYRVENVASTCQQGRPFQVESIVAG